jgi:Protein of unknown function (DUF2796)
MSARRWLIAAVCLLAGAVVILAATMQVATPGDAKSSPSAAKRGHQHGAHVHGTAKLDIAVEERTAMVEFEAPAASIMGFEHKAKTTADQRKQAMALDLLKNKIGSMLIFESALGCSFLPTSLDVVQQSDEHAEVHGLFVVTCDSPLTGSKVRFAFTETFPAIRTVNVQVVAATQQVGATIKQDRGVVEVPR